MANNTTMTPSTMSSTFAARSITSNLRDRERSMITLYRVEAPSFVAGFEVDEDRVVRTAPVLRRWLSGRRVGNARHICWERGWKVTKLEEGSLRTPFVPADRLSPSRVDPASRLQSHAGAGPPRDGSDVL
jgi:hypothetical protein